MASEVPDTAPHAPRRRRRYTVWLAPVLVAGAVGAGAALESGGASGAAPDLAPRSVAQLLNAVGTSGSTALSGKITETTALGLPELPGANDAASLSWQSFLTGSHSLRVWVDGPRKQRLAVIGQLSEADVVHNGRDLWTYTSDTNTATHTVLPRHKRRASGEGAVAVTPSAAVRRVLRAIDPSTSVTLGRNRVVAGQTAYTLVIAPRDHRSTIRKITIAIDSRHFVPLQLQVFGSGDSPAFQVGFTDISFRTPSASTFRFKVPAGATVSKNPFTGAGEHRGLMRPKRFGPQSGLPRRPSARPRVIGSGWTSVLELHSGPGQLAGLLDQFTNPVGSSGERELHTALVNVVVLPDGRTFVGAVRMRALEHIASTTSR